MKKVFKKLKAIPTYLLVTFFTISMLTGFIVGFSEYTHFEHIKSDTVLGLNEIWQMNLFSHTRINLDDYNKATKNAFANMEAFLGYGKAPGLKGFFDGFINSASSLNKQSLYNHKLLTDRCVVPSAHWSVRSDVAYATNEINYDYGQIIGQPSLDTDSTNAIVSANFVHYLQQNLGELREHSKINLEDPSLEFSRYNDIILKSISKNENKEYEIISQLIKLHRFFISSRKSNPDGTTDSINRGNMVVYPAHTFESFNTNNTKTTFAFKASERSWWKAAFDKTFPIGFERNENDVKFGLTGMYNDIQDDNSVLLQDRTFFCKFKLPSIENYEFVACIDLFLDDSEFGTNKFISGSTNKIFGVQSVSSWILPISYRLGFILDGIITAILLLIATLKFRVAIYKTIKIHIQQYDNENLVEFYLERQDERNHLPRKYEDQKASLNILQTRVKDFESSLNRTIGVTLNAINKLFSFGISGSLKDSYSEKTSQSMNYNLDITLGIDNTNIYRCIEFWNIKDSKTNQELGIFMVKWLNTIFTKEEIAITLIGPLRRFEGDENANKIIARLKKRLEEHLLQSEDKKITVKFSVSDTVEQQFRIPPILNKKEIGADSLQSYFMKKGHSKRLLERKLIFQTKARNNEEFRLFLSLYQTQADIYAVCGISFLRNLNERKKLKDFFENRVDRERIFIESSENEFVNFYVSLESKIREAFLENDLDRFYLASFPDPEKLSIYKSYDFALAKNSNDETEYVLFFYDNSTSNELGWVSWRNVDIEFYERVYSIIKDDMQRPLTSIRDVIVKL